MKQWIKWRLVNFICETKQMSKHNNLIVITCSRKVVQWPETMRFQVVYFSYIYIHWAVRHEEQVLKSKNRFFLFFYITVRIRWQE